MRKRSVVAATAVSAALLAGAGMLARTAVAAPKKAQKPAIANVDVRPRRLPTAGGIITVTVRVKPNGATINSVTCKASTPGKNGFGPSGTLSNGGSGNVYTGEISVPANSTKQAQSSNIFVEVDSNRGRIGPKKQGQVNVAGGKKRQGGELPPGLPPI